MLSRFVIKNVKPVGITDLTTSSRRRDLGTAGGIFFNMWLLNA
jgi:hypothetical protein